MTSRTVRSQASCAWHLSTSDLVCDQLMAEAQTQTACSNFFFTKLQRSSPGGIHRLAAYTQRLERPARARQRQLQRQGTGVGVRLVLCAMSAACEECYKRSILGLIPLL